MPSGQSVLVVLTLNLADVHRVENDHQMEEFVSVNDPHKEYPETSCSGESDRATTLFSGHGSGVYPSISTQPSIRCFDVLCCIFRLHGCGRRQDIRFRLTAQPSSRPNGPLGGRPCSRSSCSSRGHANRRRRRLPRRLSGGGIPALEETAANCPR